MLTIVLGVAIGLVFVFMLFSLFLATALEAVAALLKLRGRALRVAIARLVEDPAHPPGRGFGLVDRLQRHSPAAATRPSQTTPGDAEAGLLTIVDAVDPDAPEFHEAATESATGDHVAPRPLSFAAVFAHPLVAGAHAAGTPSYVSAANFTSALLHALRGDAGDASLAAIGERIDALPPGQLRDALQTAVQESRDDVDRFRHAVERWYDHAMDRLSGEYKRFSQAATFLVALALAIVYNIDAIAIGQRLYVDQDLRNALVAQAADYIEKAGAAAAAASPDGPAAAASAASVAPAAADSATGAAASATAASAAAGASRADFEARLQAAQKARELLLQVAPNTAGEQSRVPVIGWLVTALAGMLGAPFWFDLLQKLVSLRGAGPKPMPAMPKTTEVR